MDKCIAISTPLTEEIVQQLQAGDRVLISGVIYTARDAAHGRLEEEIAKGKPTPISLENETIYYVGPCPAKPGQVIGSAGPTTSGRVDRYTPLLLAQGVKGMIGKGNRSKEVVQSIIKNKAVYFAAVGGAGALIAKTIIDAQVVAYEDLGPEAIYRLKVKDFPAVVAVDSKGQDLYELGKAMYRGNEDRN